MHFQLLCYIEHLCVTNSVTFPSAIMKLLLDVLIVGVTRKYSIVLLIKKKSNSLGTLMTIHGR